jgi:hypothetical protein
VSGRNYVVSPRREFVDVHWVEGQWCGSNGQCIKFECQEWIGGQPCYPDLVREDRYGFAICPRCGVSYGAAALTGADMINRLEAAE